MSNYDSDESDKVVLELQQRERGTKLEGRHEAGAMVIEVEHVLDRVKEFIDTDATPEGGAVARD